MVKGENMNLEPWQLQARTTVRVVRAQAGDAELIANFYLGLSVESRYQRFFSHHPRYTPEELALLSHPDAEHGFALIAIAGEGADAVVVGDLRCVTGEAGDKEAEIAIVVADGWRRRGIGRLLLCGLIAYARATGYTGLQAYVASTNTGMLKLIREFGFHFEPLAGGGAMRVLRKALAHSWNDAAWQAAQPGCPGFVAVTNYSDAAISSL
jgi:acetyltransferase